MENTPSSPHPAEERGDSSSRGATLRSSPVGEIERSSSSYGPGPLTSTRAGPASSVSPWAIIAAWIVLSSTVILFNRDILVGKAPDAGFPYPVALTSLHLLFQTVVTRLLHRFTTLVSGTSADPSVYASLPFSEDKSEDNPGAAKAEEAKRAKEASVEMDWMTWRKEIFPPAVLFSVSLVLSNTAYLYISTAFISMLKAFAPVAILLAAFAFGTKAYSLKLIMIVLVISAGILLASLGEGAFNWTGFCLQMAAIVVEATRVTLIQLLLAGKNMSPLKALYFTAPICLAINLALILPFEGAAPFFALPTVGLFTILANCTLTFMLSISSVYLIGLSTMVLSLSKVVKDIILVAGAAILLGDKLTLLQVVGYALATAGMLWYKSTAT